MSTLSLTVNGRPVSLDVPENRYLAEVLRYDLGLTGTKIGCNEAECGICTVLVDGAPVNSCIYPAFKAAGRSVETVENLKQGDRLHPIQQAFLDHGAIQCGICTPGLMMNAKALIDTSKAENRDVTAKDIKIALKDTYCRCTGYQSVINAILQASGKNIKPYIPAVKNPGRSVGQAVPNPDALKKLTGEALYTDDFHFPGMLYARTKRAGIPHGRILSIDVSEAEALPGVHAVLTHSDVPGRKLHGLVTVDWPVLCYDKVRYAGDAVACVAAETEDIAARAVELIRVEYEELPAVTDPIQAARSESPVLHESRPDGNLLKHIKVSKGSLKDGFAQADVIVEKTYRTPTTEHLFLEPECSIGIPRGYDPSAFGGTVDASADRGPGHVHQKTTVYCGSQIPYLDREQVALSMGLRPEQVRIVAALMGGGFGGKEDIAGQVHVALLAEKTRRPVKMLYTRQESLLVHPKRHATVIRMKTGATNDGRLVAVEAELFGDGGAYASLSEKVMTRATTHASGPYDVPNVKVDCYAMYTNNTPSGAFRGFGVTQSCFAVESNMDLVAEQLGLDPVDFRQRNALDVGGTTCTGQTLLESCGMKECMRLVQQDMADQHPAGKDFEWSWEEDGYLYAWGLGAAYKNTGLGGGAPDFSGAALTLWVEKGNPRAQVRTSAAEMGQGLPAVLTACVAEELGMESSDIDVLLGDTDFCPDGGPTTASRQTYLTGNAARHAAIKARAVLSGAIADNLGVAPGDLTFRRGKVTAGEQEISLAEAITMAEETGRSLDVEYQYWAPKTQPLGTGGKMHIAFGFGAQAVLLRVEKSTGRIDVLKVVTANDVGRAINPLTLEGQIEGGIVMCMGNALTEHYVLDQGQPWTSVMARYKMPGIKQTPEIISRIVEHETTEGPFGAKGVGELCSIPTSPAITNAIYRATGVRFMSLPVDQDSLLLAMNNGDKEVHLGWGDLETVPRLHDANERERLVGTAQ